jgi:hypothetical protein
LEVLRPSQPPPHREMLLPRKNWRSRESFDDVHLGTHVIVFGLPWENRRFNKKPRPGK